MLILAHRGLWTELPQRNTRTALRNAFDLGFGVETDIRDHNGELVISHDMATRDCIPLSVMLQDYNAAGRPGQLALNIKSDGLAGPLMDELSAFEGMREKAFVFDMSVPDTLHYLRKDGLRVFTRHSEYEPQPPLELQAAGIWMDCFVNQWVDPTEIIHRIRLGQIIAVVSPELHKRERYQEYWRFLKMHLDHSGIDRGLLEKSLMLCTDYPREAHDLFSRAKNEY